MSAAADTLGIQNIGQISIIVKDVDRATAFYRDVLGCRCCSRYRAWRFLIAAECG